MSYITDNELFLYKNTLIDYCNSGAIINSGGEEIVPTISKTITCKYNRGTIITNDEQLTILTWAVSIMCNLRKLDFRRAEYILDKDDPDIPPIIFEIKKRIEQKECLVDSDEYMLKGRGHHFMGFVFPNGKIMKHTDKNDDENNLYQIRFNVFILLPGESFCTYYNSKIINTKSCTYAICLSGIENHWTDTNLENLPRISLSFGYSLPICKINKLLQV
jgi:hypothetical protein